MLSKRSIARLENKLMKNAAKVTPIYQNFWNGPFHFFSREEHGNWKEAKKKDCTTNAGSRVEKLCHWVGGDAGDVEQVVEVQGAEWSAGSDLYGLENICLSFWLIFVYDYDMIL